jgi:hypothetical protein
MVLAPIDGLECLRNLNSDVTCLGFIVSVKLAFRVVSPLGLGCLS